MPARPTQPVCAFQPGKTTDHAGDIRALLAHKPARGKLAPGEVHHFRIALESGRYARIKVEALGAGLRLSIQGPDGQPPEDHGCEAGDQINVSVIAMTSGEYNLAVGLSDGQQQPGQYDLAIEAIRPDQAADSRRVGADTACEEAGRLRASWKIDASLVAIEKYAEAAELFSSLKDRRGEVSALRKIGDTHLFLSDALKALAYYERALALSRRSRNIVEEAHALNCISEAYGSGGESDRALASAAKALRLSRRSRNRQGEARALQAIGDSYYGLGDLQKSLGYYRRALQLWRQLGDYRKQAESLVGCGYASVDLSDVEGAFRAYDEALDLGRRSGDRRAQALALRAIGNLQTKLGENQRALNSFEESLEILQSVEDRLLKATVLAGLGYIRDRLGDYKKAIEYFDQAIAIFQAINNRWGEAEALMDCGLAYYSLGEPQRALDNFGQAKSYFTALGMPRYVAQTLRNMGLVYDRLGDKVRALACYKRSLQITRKGQDQRDEAYTLNYIGRSYEGLGDGRSAMSYYNQALPLNRLSLDPLGESLTLYNLARVERRNGKLSEARAQVEAAISLAESLRTRVADQDLRIKYFASAYQYYELYIDILMRLSKERPGDGLEALGFEAAERARARALLEMLKKADTEIRPRVDPALLDRERTLQRQLDGKRASVVRNGSEGRALGKEIESVEAEYDRVQRQIEAVNPEYAALLQASGSSLKEIQRQVMDDDTLLLEYFLGEERSYLWAISREAISSYELPGRVEIEEIASRVKQLLTSAQLVEGETLARRQERLKQSEPLYWQQACLLSDTLLKPVAALLEAKRLIIVADGVLQYIPFGALPHPASPSGEMTPLMLEHEITYEPSASALATLRDRARSRRPAPNAIAILADPVFEWDDSRLSAGNEDLRADGQSHGAEAYLALRGGGVLDRRDNIPRLIASRDEADSIMAMVPRSLGLKAIGFDASKETAINPDLGRYRIVHFATHGIFNGEEPRLSGLVLSLFDRYGKPQDGFLGLDDIYNLRMPADLVVLSACNTGLGKYMKGEGLLGLTRGFMYAGAARVMASLWRVDDEATAELMKIFYKSVLEEQKSPAAALRKAQLAMWRQKRWRSPYFWAAFVLQGEYEGRIDMPETTSGRGLELLISALALVLSAAAIFAVRHAALKRGYEE